MNPREVEMQTFNLGEYAGAVEERLISWEKQKFRERLWARDTTLWFRDPVPELANRLGWLVLPETSREQLTTIASFAEEIKSEGFRNVVLLGMGGSSLAPRVYQKTFGNAEGYPELIAMDTSHPDAVGGLEDRVDLEKTLFIVASKSGKTLETMALFQYFWRRVKDYVHEPGRHFIAITDPSTPLEDLAREKCFRMVFFAAVDLGGRYSALTAYGLVPAALIGVDVRRILDRALAAAERSGLCPSKGQMAGLALGAAMGELAKRGRDKITLMASSSVADLPVWLEQLIAESTGKDGKGIIPIVSEPLVDPDRYGRDRFFVLLSVEGDDDQELQATLSTLERKGHPTARIMLRDRADLGMEILSWEVAVASAGSVLGIHPFNQPDVEISKELARRAMAGKGSKDLDVETIPTSEHEELRVRMDAWLSDLREGDYVSIQAYLGPSEGVDRLLESARTALLERTGSATTLGYGPGFLHSTGQLHKGGPNTGLFLQIVDQPQKELAVPGSDYSFNHIIAAQSVGDFVALRRRGRRVLRVSVDGAVEEGLKSLELAIGAGLSGLA